MLNDTKLLKTEHQLRNLILEEIESQSRSNRNITINSKNTVGAEKVYQSIPSYQMYITMKNQGLVIK